MIWTLGNLGDSRFVYLLTIPKYQNMKFEHKIISKPVIKSPNTTENAIPKRDIPKRDKTEYDREKRGKRLRVASWNVGSMRRRGGELVEALDRRMVDICCVQEHRWRGESARMITGKDSRYKFYWVGNQAGNKGVGVLVKEKWVENVMNVTRINDRLMMLKLIFGRQIVTIVSTYAPQVGLDEATKDVFWDELIRVVGRVDDREMVVLGGDLNGHVGAESQGYEGVHGGHGFGIRNREGERILEFGDAMEMIVCNTMFVKDRNKLITYTSGVGRSQIDYFMVRKRDRKRVWDVKAIPCEECVQQHKLLVCDLRIKKLDGRQRSYMPRRKIWKLRNPETQRSFYEELNAQLAGNEVNGGVNEQFSVLKDNLLKATDRVCGWTRGPPRHKVVWWWNAEVEFAIKEKRKLYKEWKKGGDKEVYLVAKRRARKEVYRAKTVAQGPLLESLNSREGRNRIFKVAKQMKKENSDIVGEQCVRNDDGRIVVGPEEIKNAWAAHYNRLLNVEFEWDRENLEPAEPVAGPWPRIEKEAVSRAINRMKWGKAAGVSELTAEMLKASGDIGVDLVTNLVNAIMYECRVPDDWLRSVIVNVYKGKGDALERGNYRGIKLLDQVMKIMERVLEDMLRDRVTINDMQFGFMPGKGTTDAIFVVRQLQEKYRAKKKELFYVFVDLEKAFDRVPREVVEWALRKLRVEEWLVRVVMAFYEGARTQVRVNGELSNDFPVEVGVHQGSVLSPLLFIMVLEALSMEFRSGLPFEMLYADDLVLIAENEIEAQEKYRRWRDGLNSKGLRVNVDKTKVLVSREGGGTAVVEGRWPCAVCRKGVGNNSVRCTRCDQWVHYRCSGVRGRLQDEGNYVCGVCRGEHIVRERQERIELAGESFSCVEEFCYLGDMICAGGGAEASSVARVRSGWKKFRELLPLLTKRGVSFRVKGQLYAACVRSVMLYGSETWAVKEEDVRRLKRTEMGMMRWMCGASLNDRRGGGRITGDELRGRLGLEDIGVVMRRGRLRWFGHVERMEENNWVKRVRGVNVEGAVARGRPKKTWDEVIQRDLRDLGLNRETARDRAVWRATIR